MSQEELENHVRNSGSLIERLDKCHEMIGKMCKEGRPPKMTIPVQWHDEDFFISVTLQDAIRAQQDAYRTGTPHEHLQADFDYICVGCGELVIRRR